MCQRYYADVSEKASFTLTHKELFYAWIATKLKFFPDEDSLASYFYISTAVGSCFLVMWHRLLDIAGGQLLAVGLLSVPFPLLPEGNGEGRQKTWKIQRITTYILSTFCCVFGGRSPFHPPLFILQYNANAVCSPRICIVLSGRTPSFPSSFKLRCALPPHAGKLLCKDPASLHRMHYE